jgi:hypothetical protein
MCPARVLVHHGILVAVFQTFQRRRLSPALSHACTLPRRAGDERIDWLLHKKPLFHLHWKEGRVPEEVRAKIVVIPGDLHEPDLGLSPSDRARILSEVDFVVHSAASISFFEHIHTLLDQNYEVPFFWRLPPALALPVTSQRLACACCSAFLCAYCRSAHTMLNLHACSFSAWPEACMRA